MSSLGASTFIDIESRKNKPQIKVNQNNLELTQSPRKKSTPRINKSFGSCNISKNNLKNNDSFSKDRPKTVSMGNMTPSNRRVSSMKISTLNSSGKLSNGHPGPKELEESKTPKAKKELISELIEKITNEIELNNYEKALQSIKKLVKDDPNNPKSLHLRAQCYMGIKNFKLAIPDFLKIIQDHPMYNKQIYLELATCFIESKDYSTAIRQITRGLLKFPSFIDGYLSRGAVYNQMKKWDKAIGDFSEAISLCPTDGIGYLGLSESLLGMNDIPKALKVLEQATKHPSALTQVLSQRGKIFFQTQDYNKALEDFNRLIELENNNAEAHYYKAFSLLGQNNLIDAAVSLEQVIKYDSSKKLTGPAIYNLGAIKIKQRDFYGAHFTFQRSIESGLEIEEQIVLKSYVEAILLLIKRKFEEGITELTKIIKKKHMIIQEYLGNCFAYRGYAYASTENHEKAVKDLESSKKFQELDLSSQYNCLISQAIVLNDYENALNLLIKASELFPRNIEPIEYKAAILFSKAKEEKKTELALKAKELLDSALKIRDSESDLYFFRGILLYYIGNTVDAIYDFEKAIDKAEDNVPNHFLARGLCSARLKMYKEAIQDFSIVIQLDEKYADAYYYRGKCGLILDDSASALHDFKKMLALKPNDFISHMRIGSLLLLTGTVDEALKAYENANVLSQNSMIITQKINCYLIQENLSAAILEINKYNQDTKTVQVNYDIEVLTILQNALLDKENGFSKTMSQLTNMLQYKNEGNFCSSFYIHWYKGAFFFLSGDFQKAHAEFLSIGLKKKKKTTVWKEIILK